MAAVQIGGYSLKTKFIVNLFTFFALLVHGVSDVGTDRVSMIVKEGDTVKLHTNITINQQNRIRWYFNKTLIARLNLTHSCTDVQCNKGTERFRDRLKLDHQTGSLNITNTRTTDSGLYTLQIFRSRSSKMVFKVDIREVAEMKRKTGKEGKPVILDSPIVKNPDDVMTLYLNDTRIAGDQNSGLFATKLGISIAVVVVLAAAAILYLVYRHSRNGKEKNMQNVLYKVIDKAKITLMEKKHSR